MTGRSSVVIAPRPEGGTREDAPAMAKDCVEALILAFLDRGDEIPEEGGRAEVATIEVDHDALHIQVAAERAVATA